MVFTAYVGSNHKQSQEPSLVSDQHEAPPLDLIHHPQIELLNLIIIAFVLPAKTKINDIVKKNPLEFRRESKSYVASIYMLP